MTGETAWDLPDPFTQTLVVSAGDIDGLGHTNNGCYVVWCEACAWEHSRALGLTVADYQRLDRGVAIQRAEYNYTQPSLIGDQLIIGTWLTGCDNRLRLERRFQIRRQDNGETVLRGHWLLIGINMTSGKPARFPPEFIASYGAAVCRPDEAQPAGYE
ncbi:MAG: thioesterase family protein [Pseudohongiellaceae bacterium]|jgi:acyl-CoA thioester hydrolase